MTWIKVIQNYNTKVSSFSTTLNISHILFLLLFRIIDYLKKFCFRVPLTSISKYFCHYIELDQVNFNLNFYITFQITFNYGYFPFLKIRIQWIIFIHEQIHRSLFLRTSKMLSPFYALFLIQKFLRKTQNI